MIFVSEDSVEVLDASAKYLRCMGYFYWTLGILNVCRMVTQGLGYSGRAVFSGVMEMLARTIVSLGFVVWFYCDLFCRSDSLGGSEPLYCADVSLLHQEVYEEAGSGESNAAGVRNIPGCFA